MIGEQAVSNASGGDLRLRIEGLLIMVFVHIAPPGLGVADKVHLRKFREHFMEALDAGVVGVMHEVHEHRHLKFLRDFGETLKLWRIASDLEFLLANANRAES